MIVQKLDASMLIEAGAGSGKTTSLVDRMLALIGAGNCTVDRMAAVTFTRKAAAELKGRFQIALEEIIKKLEDAGYLGELLIPEESNISVTESREKKDFRHTAAFEHTKQISFHRATPFSGRALWPCPGMGVIQKQKVED